MATMRIEKEATALYRAGYQEGLRFALQVVHDSPEPTVTTWRDVLAAIMMWAIGLIAPLFSLRVAVRTLKFDIARKISAERAKS